MNRQRLDSPLVYVGAHNVYYVKLTVKVLYFTIHIHTQINQYVVISVYVAQDRQYERLSSWNQRTEVHDWKRRSERLVRASGHIYTIVRPGWFDYNNDDEHRIVMLQGDRRHAGTPEDGVISREQIAQVLVTALSNDAATNKTFELVAERGEAQQDLTLLFAELRNDNPQKNDGVFDIDNMPLTEEPECVINDLNLYSKNSKI